jgi:hypothetical protein
MRTRTAAVLWLGLSASVCALLITSGPGVLAGAGSGLSCPALPGRTLGSAALSCARPIPRVNPGGRIDSSLPPGAPTCLPPVVDSRENLICRVGPVAPLPQPCPDIPVTPGALTPTCVPGLVAPGGQPLPAIVALPPGTAPCFTVPGGGPLPPGHVCATLPPVP